MRPFRTFGGSTNDSSSLDESIQMIEDALLFRASGRFRSVIVRGSG